jgi:hypothetical protein
MTKWFGSGLVVIPNLVRDLGFEFLVLKPRPVGGALYFLIILAKGTISFSVVKQVSTILWLVKYKTFCYRMLNV